MNPVVKKPRVRVLPSAPRAVSPAATGNLPRRRLLAAFHPKPFLMIIDWLKVGTDWKIASEIILPVPPEPAARR